MVNLRPHLRIIIFLVYILSSFSVIAVNVTVTGVVRDSVSREPVSFATVMLKGTERGVLTDDDGRYTISTFAEF